MDTDPEPTQRERLIELAHIRARSIGNKRVADFKAYERVKAMLAALGLTPAEYEQNIQQAAKEMRL